MSHPIEGQVLLLAGAKASVASNRLPALVERAQEALGPRLEEYHRRYECAHEGEDARYFFVPDDHWETIGDRLSLDRRETDALRRVHEEQLKRLGKRLGRREEFETALDLRSAVVVGTASEPS